MTARFVGFYGESTTPVLDAICSSVVGVVNMSAGARIDKLWYFTMFESGAIETRDR